jgi:hypothetical protein
MEVGLDREPLGWDVVLKHEATDRARDAGYCDASDPSCSQDADGFCVGCAVVTTWCNHGEIMAQIGPDGFPL